MFQVLTASLLHFYVIILLHVYKNNRFIISLSLLISILSLHYASYNKVVEILTVYIAYKFSQCFSININPLMFILFIILDNARNYLLKKTRKGYLRRLMSEDRILMVNAKDYILDCPTMFEKLTMGLNEINYVSSESINKSYTVFMKDEIENHINLNLNIDSNPIIDFQFELDEEKTKIDEESLVDALNHSDDLYTNTALMKMLPYIDENLDNSSSTEILFDESEINIISENNPYSNSNIEFSETPTTEVVEDENEYRFKNKFITEKSIHLNINDNKIADSLYKLLTFYDNEPLEYKVFKNYHTQLMKEFNNTQNSLNEADSILNHFQIFTIIVQFLLLISINFFFVKRKCNFFTTLHPVAYFFLFPSCKKIIEAFFFLVITHPFDCNDRVYINRENMIVKQITILCTIFETWNGKIVYIKNSILRDKLISNVRRAKSMKWEQSFYTNDTVSMLMVARELEKIGCKVYKEDIEYAYMKKFRIVMKHRWNFQNVFFMWKEHNRFEKAMIEIIRKYNVEYVPMENRYMIIK